MLFDQVDISFQRLNTSFKHDNYVCLNKLVSCSNDLVCQLCCPNKLVSCSNDLVSQLCCPNKLISHSNDLIFRLIKFIMLSERHLKRKSKTSRKKVNMNKYMYKIKTNKKKKRKKQKCNDRSLESQQVMS